MTNVMSANYNSCAILAVMNYDSILANVQRHVELTKEEEQFFVSILIPLKLEQGEFVEKAGEISNHIIHVLSGCLMTCYSDNEGNDQVIQFSPSGWWTGDLHSLTEQVPSIYSTRAM